MKSLLQYIREFIQGRVKASQEWVFAKWEVIRDRLNMIRPTFLGKAGLADILVFFYNGMTHRRFTLNAMAMAYRFFFAVFPGLILIFTLIPAFDIPGLQEQVTGFLGAIVPGDSMGFMNRVVDEFFSKPSPGLIYINVGLLLFSTMSGIKVMMSAFSKDSEHFRRRNIFSFNFVAFVLLLGLLVIFLGTIALLVWQEFTVKDLIKRGVMTENGWEKAMVQGLFWLLTYIALLIAVSLLYYLGPSTKRRGRFFSPGAIAGSVLIMLAVTAFRLFFTQFSNYNKVYGSISAIMVLMVWFYWISIVLLIGFELNAAILAASHKVIGGPDESDGRIERRREGDTTDDERRTKRKASKQGKGLAEPPPGNLEHFEPPADADDR